MKQLSFKQWELMLAISVFVISLTTYVLTLEPTVSFWDCGEYISTSAKLQVGHPPGAPLFQMIGAFFAMFAFSPSKVAYMVNLMSAIFSAFSVLFLFLSTVHILIKYILKDKQLSKISQFVVLAASFVGALAFAFSDTFWFSAVEAEVYAGAIFMMSLLFWIGLKWVDNLDQPRGDRWLILMTFVIGLSFGIHFLALLVIPAIGMLYYFKTAQKITLKSFVIANLVVFGILIFIFKMLMPWTLKLYSFFEIFFTNSIGLPFNSGTIIAVLLTIFLFYKMLTKAYKTNNRLMEAITLSVLFMLIGFSTWVILPIRANADTVINENAPNNARELLAYYNREQYGETHLFYGPVYTAYQAGLDKDEPYVDDKPKYEQDKENGKYAIVNNYEKAKQNFSHKHWTILPRLWDNASVNNYKWIIGKSQSDNTKPTFFENMNYMFSYQFGYMYWRYLMWNFVGRQDDIQGRLDNHGNWLSGIRFIDEMHLDKQENLPSEVLKNKARNTYFFLPFILAFIGMLFHSKKDNKNFYVVLIAFLMTGLAIVFYTNVRSFEPRERDYAVVGSFYFFALWLGIGVYALYDYLKKYVDKKIVAISVVLLSFFAAPILMASENWDDHDRSQKYSALNNAKSYLNSCQKNAILYTVGDNDTFPLWYAQDIEGERRDMRLINTALFNTSWYIDQQKRKIYESDALTLSMEHKQYVYGTRDVLYPNFIKDTLDIKEFVKICLDDRFSTENPDNGQTIHFYPSRYIRVPVNKNNVLKYGIVSKKYEDKILDEIILDVGEAGMYKAGLAMLDQLANNDWKRPVYFTGGSFKDEDYLWAKKYLQLEGLTYKLVPIETLYSDISYGMIDTDIMYKNVKKWKWGNMNKGIYLDPETRRNSLIYRTALYRLASELYSENKREKAIEILNLSIDKMPIKPFGFYSSLLEYVDLYYFLEENKTARDIATKIIINNKEYLDYYASLSMQAKINNAENIQQNYYMYREFISLALKHNDDIFVKQYIDDISLYKKKFPEILNQSVQEKNNKPDMNKFQFILDTIDKYYKNNDTLHAREFANKFLDMAKKGLNKYADSSTVVKQNNFDSIEYNFILLNEILRCSGRNNDRTFVEGIYQDFTELMIKYQDLLEE